MHVPIDILGLQVVEAKIQHITLNQWLPHLGIAAEDVRNWKSKSSKPDVSLEFFVGFRFGACS